MQSKSLRICKKGLLNILAWIFIFPLSTMYASLIFAIDPPTNIQLNDGRLSWDAVEGADQYHLYYFDQPIPSISNLGNYVRLTGGTRWALDSFNDPFGYYTVVAVRTDEFSMPVEFSKITESEVVPYLDPSDDSSSSASLISIVIGSQQCDNMVAGSICAAVCTSPFISTGGACRADAGVTLHQRALETEYQCLAQQDTAVVQADVYCLNATSQ